MEGNTMTSTIKADVIEAASGTNTDLELTGKGSGVVNLEAGSKLGGTALTSTFNAYVAPSTSGNVLTSNGSAWTSAAAPAGGALVILAEDTNVTVATKTFTGLDLTPYNIVYFELQRYNNESGGSNGYLTMEISVDNGSTWLSTNKWVHFRAEGTGTWSFGSQGNSVAAMQICTFQWPDLDQYLWGEMIFAGGHGSECQIYTRSIGDKTTGSNIVSGTSHAVSTDTSGSDIDAIRFATTVDDFGGAEIRIWGGMK